MPVRKRIVKISFPTSVRASVLQLFLKEGIRRYLLLTVPRICFWIKNGEQIMLAMKTYDRL